MRVVVTSTAVPVTDDDVARLNAVDATVESIDGRDREALVAGVREADALIVLAETIDDEVMAVMPRCRVITRLGVGVDSVDLAAAAARGIVVTNVPDANYREVATHALAMALTLTRRIPQLDRAVKQESWVNTMAVAGSVRRPDEQTFGLLGLGRIGRRVAEMAAVVGFRVIAFDPAISDGDGVELVSFDELIASSDVLSLHVPLLESTRDIVDADVLARMPAGSVLVNVSRGGLVDERALADALRSGHLAGAGLDAFANEPLEPSSPLRELDSVLLTPHAGHWSEDSWLETRRKAFADVASVLSGRPPRYPVA